MNLKFKSSEPDLKFNIQSQFRLLNQNLLYQTRQSDTILRLINQLINDRKLQTQVTEFYGDDNETSPQTDSEEHFEDKPGDIKWHSEQ